MNRIVDRIVHEVDIFKIKAFLPNKDEMPESSKAIRASINYTAKMIAILRARRKRG